MPGHWLVILEKGVDWEIEHEDDCPWIELYASGPLNDGPVLERDCLVGRVVVATGIDDHLTDIYGKGWRDLEPGRYEIRAWTYRSIGAFGSYEGEEAGIEFVDAGVLGKSP